MFNQKEKKWNISTSGEDPFNKPLKKTNRSFALSITASGQWIQAQHSSTTLKGGSPQVTLDTQCLGKGAQGSIFCHDKGERAKSLEENRGGLWQWPPASWLPAPPFHDFNPHGHKPLRNPGKRHQLSPDPVTCDRKFLLSILLTYQKELFEFRVCGLDVLQGQEAAW